MKQPKLDKDELALLSLDSFRLFNMDVNALHNYLKDKTFLDIIGNDLDDIENSLIILKDSSGNTVQLSGDSVSITSALNNNILSINCGTLASGSITLKTGAVTDTLFNKFTVSSDYVYKFP